MDENYVNYSLLRLSSNRFRRYKLPLAVRRLIHSKNSSSIMHHCNSPADRQIRLSINRPQEI